MAARANCRCQKIDLYENLILQDIGVVMVNVARKSIDTFLQKVAAEDSSLNIKRTAPTSLLEDGYSIKAHISTYTQVVNLYKIMAEMTYTYQFLPFRDRILFDCQQLTESAERMMDFVTYCKMYNLGVFKLHPRKRLECSNFEDIYKVSLYCHTYRLTDLVFYGTDLDFVTKKEHVKSHVVVAVEYK